MFTRVIVIVLDSVGIGALPDAHEYGDQGSNTLQNIARSQGGLFLPTLEKLGLGKIEAITGLKNDVEVLGGYGKMAEISRGKDTTSGHWEIVGSPVFKPFPVYSDGFPAEIIEKFEALIGRKILGNKAASGTVIIEELGEEHLKTGRPIVYTSADSVFQIAAHEEVIPLAELYNMCKIAREQVCVGKHAVGRIIARPFIGRPGAFVRTANRHDYSLEPERATVLDEAKAAGLTVIGVGKIADIFAKRGITQSYPTKSNEHGMDTLLELAGPQQQGIIMANLVDFDSVYGHRRNIAGYAKALTAFDTKLAQLLLKLQQDDLLIITADHGCDPTHVGSDHTREYVPLLTYHQRGFAASLGIRDTFADVAATIADNFKLPMPAYGQSFLTMIVR